jgi:integrase
MKPQKIKGLYQKRGWFYYQPPTGDDGTRPKAVALRTKDFLEAINLSYAERDRFQLVADSEKGRMAPAIDLYIREKLAARCHSPITSYNTSRALHQICSEMGNPLLNDLNDKNIDAWARRLRARKCRIAIRVKNTEGIVREREKTKLSDSAVAAYGRILRAFINSCHAEGKILKKPSQFIPSGRCKKTRKMRFTSFKERDMLLDSVCSPELAFIYHVGFLAGLRLGEMLAMEPDWLWFSEDGKQGKIHVQETKFWKPKDREAREIPMAPRLLDFLKKWPLEGQFVLMPKKDVYPESKKDRYNPKVSFRKHAVSCGVPWLTYHDLRHSFGSHLLQRGATIAEVAYLLGDEVRVTERHYAGLMKSNRRVVELL